MPSPPDRSGPGIRDLVAAAPDFALGATFLAAWVRPGLGGAGTIGRLLLVMLLEFIVIHSAPFMGMAGWSDAAPSRKLMQVLGLGGFYSLFVVGFALAFHTWAPLLGFWGLTLNRLLGPLVGQARSGEERALMQRGWAAGALFYLAAVGLTTVLPVPSLGVTPEVIAAAHLPSSGLWVSQPYRVLAAGFLYFTGLGLSELWQHRWADKGVRNAQTASR
jgi:hypothetical protein